MAIVSMCPVSLTHLSFFKMLLFVVFKDVYNILEIKVGEISYFIILFICLEVHTYLHLHIILNIFRLTLFFPPNNGDTEKIQHF